MIRHRPADSVKGKDVVIGHVVLIAVVICRYECLPVMGGINIQPSVENVGRWVGGEKMRYQGLVRHSLYIVSLVLFSNLD